MCFYVCPCVQPVSFNHVHYIWIWNLYISFFDGKCTLVPSSFFHEKQMLMLYFNNSTEEVLSNWANLRAGPVAAEAGHQVGSAHLVSLPSVSRPPWRQASGFVRVGYIYIYTHTYILYGVSAILTSLGFHLSNCSPLLTLLVRCHVKISARRRACCLWG